MNKIISKVFGILLIMLGLIGFFNGIFNFYNGQTQAYNIGFFMGNFFIAILFFLAGMKILQRISG